MVHGETKLDNFLVLIILGLYWGHIRVILGSYLGHIGVILALYWGYS